MRDGGRLMDIIQLSEPQEIKAFIESSLYLSTSYLYKLPQQYEDFDTLLNEAISNSGVVALTEDGTILALMLAFSYDHHRYKVIGPFIAQDFQLDDDHFQLLFDKLTEHQPEETIFNFSFEEGVQEYKPFMKQIHASYNFTDYYLEAHQDLGETFNSQNIIEYQRGFYRAFSKLHLMTFKHDAMTPEEIIESLDEHNRLFIFVSEGLLKGYLYLQVDTERNNAEIKYFSSHMDYRLKGIAFDLLEYALKYAFKHYTIHKVYFKIRNKNSKLVERFNELGFQINYEYKKYKFEPRHLHQDFSS